MTLPDYTPPPDSTPLASTFQAIRELADAVEQALAEKVVATSGTVTIPSGQTSGSATIPFGHTFPANPKVALSVGTTGNAYSVVRGTVATSAVTVTAHRPPGGSTGSTVNVVVDVIAVA